MTCSIWRISGRYGQHAAKATSMAWDSLQLPLPSNLQPPTKLQLSLTGYSEPSTTAFQHGPKSSGPLHPANPCYTLAIPHEISLLQVAENQHVGFYQPFALYLWKEGTRFHPFFPDTLHITLLSTELSNVTCICGTKGRRWNEPFPLDRFPLPVSSEMLILMSTSISISWCLGKIT